MLPIVLMMLVILLLAGVVVLYVAYPHRGESVPRAKWVGDALQKSVDAMPTIKDDSPTRR
ncbi:hypothetical protein ASG90_05795 [Nocardioides sp. Soil797]|nr:hypothetical protein ASG90_05795 [Nocardioides sp. Soil797]